MLITGFRFKGVKLEQYAIFVKKSIMIFWKSVWKRSDETEKMGVCLVWNLSNTYIQLYTPLLSMLSGFFSQPYVDELKYCILPLFFPIGYLALLLQSPTLPFRYNW